MRRRISTRATLLQQSTRPTAWAEWFASVDVPIGNPMRGPRFEQFAMVAQAAAAGLGVGMIPQFLIDDELASGRLEVLFPHSPPQQRRLLPRLSRTQGAKRRWCAPFAIG